jgi:hypothetical protein
MVLDGAEGGLLTPSRSPGFQVLSSFPRPFLSLAGFFSSPYISFSLSILSSFTPQPPLLVGVPSSRSLVGDRSLPFCRDPNLTSSGANLPIPFDRFQVPVLGGASFDPSRKRVECWVGPGRPVYAFVPSLLSLSPSIPPPSASTCARSKETILLERLHIEVELAP